MASMASDPDIGAIRRKLDSLGKRRERMDNQDEELAKEIEGALKDAYGHISVSEAANRLKMHRTTVYRVYKPHGG